ncbi:MAG: hypothetical protein GC184_00655 [Rhizobiales bacterium]|nr:hypothetical protein [Hyphomicrobiales bacterium]
MAERRWTRKSFLLLVLLPLAACASPGSGMGTRTHDAPSQSIGAGPLTPKSLLGVAPPALEARLGAPSFRRTEPSAEVWQYSGQSCSLFVYFYKGDTGSLGSTYVDARKLAGGADDETACLAEVLRQRNAPVS